MAATELQENNYYPDKQITSATKMRMITSLHEPLFNGLDPKLQSKLLRIQPDDLMKRTALREVFFPALCYWEMYRRGVGAVEWLDALVDDFGLITRPQRDKLIMLSERDDIFALGEADLSTLHDYGKDSSDPSTKSLYRRVILATP